MRSLGGEPVIWTTGLLTLEERQKFRNWNVLGYIPDLDKKASSAKRTLQRGRKGKLGSPGEKSLSMQDYHRCLDKVLMESGFLKLMEEGGAPLFVRYGDEVRYVHVKVAVSFPLNQLSNPLCSCPVVKMKHFQQLCREASDPSYTKRRKQDFLDALTELSQHFIRCDSGMFRVDFGSNDAGATVGTATDMMHAFDICCRHSV
jgi:hypothetical protein